MRAGDVRAAFVKVAFDEHVAALRANIEARARIDAVLRELLELRPSWWHPLAWRAWDRRVQGLLEEFRCIDAEQAGECFVHDGVGIQSIG